MKEQQRYQIVTHHQHRSHKTSDLCASVKPPSEASCRVISWHPAESHCSALGRDCSKSRTVIQTLLTGMQVQASCRGHWGNSMLPSLPRHRSHFPVTHPEVKEQRSQSSSSRGMNSSRCFSHLGTKQFCRDPPKRSVEKREDIPPSMPWGGTAAS